MDPKGAPPKPSKALATLDRLLPEARRRAGADVSRSDRTAPAAPGATQPFPVRGETLDLCWKRWELVIAAGNPTRSPRSRRWLLRWSYQLELLSDPDGLDIPRT